MTGLLPVPEIQYLAYLHNAEDQLRGEAASLRFFSNGAYLNPMVVRVAGLGYQKGFGGHFHNDNAVAVLRDIPGLVVAVPSRPEDAAPMLRACLGAAATHGQVSVFLEPIALYHERDLHEPGDQQWLGALLPRGPDGHRLRTHARDGRAPDHRDVRQRRADEPASGQTPCCARRCGAGARPAVAQPAARRRPDARGDGDRRGAGRRRDAAQRRRRRGRARRARRERLPRHGWRGWPATTATYRSATPPTSCCWTRRRSARPRCDC